MKEMDAEITAKCKVLPSDSMISQDLDDGMLLLQLEEDMYYGLDQTGTEMWNALLHSKTTQQAFDTLLDAYDVKRDILKQDLINFLQDMIDHKLVNLSWN